MAEKNKYLVIFQPSGARGYIEEGTPLKVASVALGVDLEGVCGEQAICGTCKIRVEEGDFEKYAIHSSRDSLSPMGPSERKFFNIRQEEQGYRLACQAKVQGNIVVFVPEESRMGKQIVRKAHKELDIELKPAVKKYYVELVKPSLEENQGDWERLLGELEKTHGLKNLVMDYQVAMELQNVIRDGEWNITVTVWNDKEVIKVESGRNEKAYGLAVDVGTSTVAGYLTDLANGKVIATASMMNPQVVYGEDVMSRISYTMTNPQGLEILNGAIIDGLNGVIEEAASTAGIKRQDIVDMTLVGNTCMNHIYLNMNPRYIGRAPFPPSMHHSIDVKARDFGFKIPPEAEATDKGRYSPCRVECPAGLSIDDFLYLIAQHKYKEALELVRISYPFPGILGRVCTHPCEKVCERGQVDEPISIRAAHRFLADYELQSGRVKSTPVDISKEEKIGIIGSGPSGLACAYDLIQRGHPVTVFEAAPKPGGMMRYGIPEYRLPRNILDNEISSVQELGVEIRTNTTVKNVEELFDTGYKAVFIGAGSWTSLKLNVPGEDAPGVIPALTFLKKANSGEKVELGDRVVVIGGGSVAIDSARLSKRLGAEEVNLICLESSDLTCEIRMPAQDLEIEQAREEGVVVHDSLGVAQIVSSNGKVSAVETAECVSVFDDDGRFAPRYGDAPAPIIEAETVIVAIGQKPNMDLFPELEKNPSGTIKADEMTLETSVQGVFAGGDVVTGPTDVVSATAAGKEAAISIGLLLSGMDMKEARPPQFKAVEDIPKEGIQKMARQVEPVLEPAKRMNFDEVELGFDEDKVTEEAKRCLHCSIYAEKDAADTLEVRGNGILISPGAYVHSLPIEAGFVGADNVGVLICEEPYKKDDIQLIIDIGTNGELIFGNKDKLISASCATGPAFEGAELKHGMRAAPGAIEKVKIDPETKEVSFKVIGDDRWSSEIDENPGAKGICGSGIIDAIPQLFLSGVIEKSGKFAKGLETPRLREVDGTKEFVLATPEETSHGEAVVVSQDDIRAIQLGKAAMYAGSKILLDTYGVDKVDKVVLAGGFGSYIDRLSAALLGMFLDCEPEKVVSVGNAAGDGARMALINVDKRDEANEFARKVEYIELTVNPKFEKIFARSMWFPHMSDKFPNLEQYLPKK